MLKSFLQTQQQQKRNLFCLQTIHKYKRNMKLLCQTIASNCNPMPSAFDFLTDRIIAYCYKNQVGLYDLDQKCVYRNIHPSKQPYPNRANCIKAFHKNEKKLIIVGYDNGDLILYGSTDCKEWRQQQAIKQKTGILAITITKDNNFVAVNNNDALITIYKIATQNNQISLQSVQQIQFPLNKTIETVALQQLDSSLVIFLGGVDQMVHCYSHHIESKQLSYHFSLTGHQNSITKLTIDQRQGQSLLLASSSKDGYIRLWKVTQNKQDAKFHKNVKSIKLQQNKQYFVFLDSVLISHQCSVTNLHWANFDHKRKLLSASLDCTICVWSQTDQEGSWSVQSRMGQFLGNKNAYFQILSNESGTQLAALNYIGSVLIWNYDQPTNKFTLRESFNGHYNEVKDIAWNYSGDFLVSVSKDQTTRVLAQHHQTKKYHEISRAQIHGYDINALCLLKTKDETFDLIACGADQKVVRIFEPPACFANYFNSFTHKNFHLFFNTVEEQEKYLLKRQSKEQPLLYETYTQGGSQVLGLMTKAQRVQRQKVVDYYNQEQEEAVQMQEQKVDLKQTKKIDFSIPPHDDYLVKHTLWPEMNKLYGHPHQLEFICRSPDSKFMATSCKALSKQAASIIVWNTESWKIHKIIQHHMYTVYAMEFSQKYLVSVSKDRKLAVYDKANNYQVLLSYEAHTRAITSVSISKDEKFIVTGSRDKTIKVHSIEEKKPVAEHEFKAVVTAVAFCQLEGKDKIICCGLLDGSVILLEWNGQKKFIVKSQVEPKYSHTQKINAIKWNNNKFATCSDDHSVSVFNITEW